jgi:hypothetical protein
MVRQRLALTAVMLLSLTSFAHAAAADSYTYRTIKVPFAGATGTRITGITDLGKLTGTYDDSTSAYPGSMRGWVWYDAKKGFQKLTYKKLALWPTDIRGDTRTIGTYWDDKAKTQRGYTLQSGKFFTLGLPVGTWVEHCALTPLDFNVCSIRDAAGVWYGVLLNHASPGYLKVYQVPGADWTRVKGMNMNNDTVGSFLGMTNTGYKVHGWWLQGIGGGNNNQNYFVVDAPCGGNTVVEDINEGSTLAAVTCHDEPYEGGITSYAFNGSRWTELKVSGAYKYTTVVTRVNNAGQFVGYYSGQDGNDHGFVASPALTNIAQR